MDTPGGSYTPPPPAPPSPTGTPAAPGGDIIYPQQPPKDPVLIAVLNAVVAGCLGYFMIGQKMKGIVAVIAWVLGLFLTSGTVAGLVSIVTAIDGYLHTQNHKNRLPLAEWTFFNDHN